MKQIKLNCDENFFYNMKKDKLNRETKLRMNLTWEDYIALLFGFATERRNKK